MMFGVLPPSSRWTLLIHCAADAEDLLADGGRARERQLRDIRVGDERGAGRRAVAVDDVEHAFRHARLEHDAPQVRRREGRLLGHLEHDAVADREGRRRLPAREQERVVPGRDRTDDAVRLALRVDEVARVGRVGASVRQLGVGREVREEVGGEHHLGGRLTERLARVPRLDLADDVRLRADLVAHPAQDPSPLAWRHPGPGAAVPDILRGTDGRVDVLGLAERDLGQDLARRGIDRVERPAGHRRDLASADHVMHRRDADGRLGGAIGDRHGWTLLGGVMAARGECGTGLVTLRWGLARRRAGGRRPRQRGYHRLTRRSNQWSHLPRGSAA